MYFSRIDLSQVKSASSQKVKSPTVSSNTKKNCDRRVRS